MNKHLKTIAGGAFALAMLAMTGEAASQSLTPVPGLPEPAHAPASGSDASPAKPSGSAPVAGPQAPNGAPIAPPAGVVLPAGYVIGPEDVLAVLFWRDKDMSAEVAVRPDGMITLPLVNDVQAAGLTPEQLRDVLTSASSKFLEDPNITVVVKEVNSRKVFITGQVGKTGAYPLTAPTTVMQLITIAGGVLEFAKSKEIIILRTENGRQVVHKFNYNDVKKGRNLKQNIVLEPGDTIVVP